MKKISIPSPAEIEPYVHSGLVTRRIVRSGSLDLAVYNYTDLCGDSKAWDQVTCACRGLVLREDTGQVVALPFSKFFKVDETPETASGVLPWHSRCAILEKYDGSLGIVFFDPGARRWEIATRGSFRSAEADAARELLLPKLRLERLEEGFTYLTEIVLRHGNAGVVRYDWDGLALIGRRNNLTGELDWPEQLPALADKIDAVPPRVYATPSDIRTFLSDFRTTNAASEGVVVTFEAGPMVKFKTDRYLQLLGTLRWFSHSNALELVAQGREAELFAAMPFEHAMPLENCVRRCISLREEIRQAVLSVFEPLKMIPDRKAFAKAVKTNTSPSWHTFMFALRDGKNISRLLGAELAARFKIQLATI